MNKITQEDIAFVLDNFDSNGNLMSATSEQFQICAKLANTGYCRQSMSNTSNWYVLGPLKTALAQKHLSKLLETNIKVCTSC